MVRPRILIADDHVLVVEALKRLLEPEYEVVGSASDGQELLDLAQQLKPDVILVDIGLPVMDGLTAGHQLRQIVPQAKLLVVTLYDDLDIAGEAMRRWASGYLLKKSAATELTKAIAEVLRGNRYITPSVGRRLNDEFTRDPRIDRERTLTPRQREVLQLLAEGRTMRETASLLHVTPRTVAFHKYRIMEEFGLKNNSELVLFAIKEHVISTRKQET